MEQSMQQFARTRLACVTGVETRNLPSVTKARALQTSLTFSLLILLLYILIYKVTFKTGPFDA